MDADVKRSGRRHNAPRCRLHMDEEVSRSVPGTLLKSGFDTLSLGPALGYLSAGLTLCQATVSLSDAFLKEALALSQSASAAVSN